MPSRSASLNLTPGLSPSRSSCSTSKPAASRSRFDLIRHGGDLGLRRIEADEMHVIRRHRPRPDDAVGVVVLLDDRRDRPRDADAVAAHHHRPLGASLVEEHARSSTSEYFVPSLKTWPTSMPRNASYVPFPQRVQASPSRAMRRSWNPLNCFRSRSGLKPKWW